METRSQRKRRHDTINEEPSLKSQKHSTRMKERALSDFIRTLFRCNVEDKPTFEDIVDDFNIYKENESDLLSTLSSDVLLDELPPSTISPITSITPTSTSTMILNISTHGGILCRKEGKIFVPIKTTIPDGIEVVKFTISTEGVVGFASSNETNFYISIINYYMDNLLTDDFDDVDLEILVDGFMLITEILKQDAMHLIKNNKMNRYDGMQFINHYDKGYNVFKLRAGDEIANKIFLRKYEEKDGNDFAITELPEKINMPDTILSVLSGSALYASCPQIKILPDVLSRIDPSTDPNSHQLITIEQLMKYYKNAGISRLIIFDFTCSVFFHERDDGVKECVENTKIANLRKRMNAIPSGRLPYGGKNKKNKTIKHKKKRNKMRRNKTRRNKTRMNKNKKIIIY
jgi:hypothetical protein